ncbi:inhibitory regulator protein ira1-related [Anaeramoeba ignava]|uniref:Inhibitory regulator protein ira1-related n=1 Tax=Anaeramoeba ignava TaxID=1746090 RepID=A0A9Q0LV95_ANAIG|nr:inhibitory regulator protein ira1-related [Anaeramoeba ignava]
MAISGNFLQIIQTKETLFNLQTNLIDMVYISNIQSVELSDQQQDQFVMRCYIESEQKTLTYKSQFCKEIVQGIEATKKKFEYNQKAHLQKREIFAEIQPSNVPGTLLNIALLNLGHENETLRKSAYNLMTVLCQNFNFSTKSRLLETEGICIPQTSFIVDLSKELAQNESHLTLEFLRESLKYFDKSSVHGKHLCLEYISPWLPNLKEYITLYLSDKTNKDYEEKYQLTREILTKLLDLSLTEKQHLPAIMIHVWKKISTVSEILIPVFEIFIQRSIIYGVDSRNSDMLAQIAVTVSSTYPKLISIHFCNEMMKLIVLLKEQTNKDNSNIQDHEKFKDILIIIRFILYLSFENLISLNDTLADLFNIYCSFISNSIIIYENSFIISSCQYNSFSCNKSTSSRRCKPN